MLTSVQDLKLKYYDMMVQHGLHHTAYLDVAKYYYKVWETPSIKEDVSGKGRIVRRFAHERLVTTLTFGCLRPSNTSSTSSFSHHTIMSSQI